MKSLLFYGGQLVQEFPDTCCPNLSQYLHTNWGLEVYNGGYIYASKDHGKTWEWFRCDLTPVFHEDVPKEYILLELLLR